MYGHSHLWASATSLLLACGGVSDAGGSADTSGGNSGSGGSSALGGNGAETGGMAATGGASPTDPRCPSTQPAAMTSCSVQDLTCTYHPSSGCLCSTNAATFCELAFPSCTGAQTAGVPYMPTGGAAAFLAPATGGAAMVITATGGSASDVVIFQTGGAASTPTLASNRQCNCTNGLWSCKFALL